MTALPTRLTIVTRRSPLALIQAELVAASLAALRDAPKSALLPVQTTGDAFTDRPLMAVGGKGLFTRELDAALLEGRADLAVHSMKDLPTTLPEGLALAAVLPREDVRDAFLSPRADHPDRLPAGAVVGTASLRRQAQLLNRRPDLTVTLLRGNVQTRLQRLAEGAVHATFLALAGLKRLGRAEHLAMTLMAPDEMLPAVGQGALGVVARSTDLAPGDGRLGALLAALDDPAARAEVTAERAVLAALDGDCRTPIAALGRAAADGTLALSVEVLMPDGSQRWTGRATGTAAQAKALGAQLGAQLREALPPGTLARLRAQA